MYIALVPGQTTEDEEALLLHQLQKEEGEDAQTPRSPPTQKGEGEVILVQLDPILETLETLAPARTDIVVGWLFVETQRDERVIIVHAQLQTRRHHIKTETVIELQTDPTVNMCLCDKEWMLRDE